MSDLVEALLCEAATDPQGREGSALRLAAAFLRYDKAEAQRWLEQHLVSYELIDLLILVIAIAARQLAQSGQNDQAMHEVLTLLARARQQLEGANKESKA